MNTDERQEQGLLIAPSLQLPKDFMITFSSDDEINTLHIPLKDLGTVAFLINEFLQSKGIESTIVKKINDIGKLKIK